MAVKKKKVGSFYFLIIKATATFWNQTFVSEHIFGMISNPPPAPAITKEINNLLKEEVLTALVYVSGLGL